MIKYFSFRKFSQTQPLELSSPRIRSRARRLPPTSVKSWSPPTKRPSRKSKSRAASVLSLLFNVFNALDNITNHVSKVSLWSAFGCRVFIQTYAKLLLSPSRVWSHIERSVISPSRSVGNPSSRCYAKLSAIFLLWALIVSYRNSLPSMHAQWSDLWTFLCLFDKINMWNRLSFVSKMLLSVRILVCHKVFPDSFSGRCTGTTTITHRKLSYC